MESISEAARWLRRHWVHFLIAPAMLIVFTVFHEAAHAAAVVLQGGELLEFEVLPSAGEWGHISYWFAPSAPHSPEAISLASYLMWLGSMAVVASMCVPKQEWPFWIASSAFLWGFVGAGGDIANACLGWLSDRGGHNDLASVLGPAQPEHGLVLAIAVIGTIAAGYLIQKRLYRSSLGPIEYAMLVGLLGLAAAALMLVM